MAGTGTGGSGPNPPRAAITADEARPFFDSLDVIGGEAAKRGLLERGIKAFRQLRSPIPSRPPVAGAAELVAVLSSSPLNKARGSEQYFQNWAIGSGYVLVATTPQTGQTVTVGSPVKPPPSVKFTGPDGKPIANAIVRFTASEGESVIGSPAAQTDINGIAGVGTWKLNSKGDHRLVASVDALSIDFTATAS